MHAASASTAVSSTPLLAPTTAVVFPEVLQQLDEMDATLVAVCQISCGDQKSQPPSRLHVMHDVWCVHAAFEEARFTLLRSMHELIMRCSSLAAVDRLHEP